jgi:hypothetical protein
MVEEKAKEKQDMVEEKAKERQVMVEEKAKEKQVMVEETAKEGQVTVEKSKRGRSLWKKARGAGHGRIKQKINAWWRRNKKRAGQGGGESRKGWSQWSYMGGSSRRWMQIMVEEKSEKSGHSAGESRRGG